MLAVIWTLLRWAWHAIGRGLVRHLVARIEVTCSCGKKFEIGGCKKGSGT